MQIMKGAEPIFLKGGENACLLIHGLTGTPSEMAYLAGRMNEAGYTVKVPLLPGHGTDIKELNITTWPAWVGAVSEELVKMYQRHENVYVAGLSMGGIMTLAMAALHGNLIQGGAVFSTPLWFKPFAARYILPILGRTPLASIIGDLPSTPGQDVKEPQGAPHVSYGRNSIPATYSLMELMGLIRKKSFLSSIRTPLLIMQSTQDIFIHSGSARRIYDNISSTKKKIIMLNDCYHAITVDKERSKVADAMIDFFSLQQVNRTP
ncbi:MAG TPA: alpha/beta fold hydrolase [Desulfomonilia bacterium]